MKERKWNKSGSRMLIESGWKKFDEQTDVISTGNVTSMPILSIAALSDLGTSRSVTASSLKRGI